MAAKKEPAIVDCVEVKKYREMRMVCSAACLSCLAISFILLVAGFVLPVLVPGITFITVWISMGLEAASIGIFQVFNTIRKII